MTSSTQNKQQEITRSLNSNSGRTENRALERQEVDIQCSNLEESTAKHELRSNRHCSSAGARKCGFAESTKSRVTSQPKRDKLSTDISWFKERRSRGEVGLFWRGKRKSAKLFKQQQPSVQCGPTITSQWCLKILCKSPCFGLTEYMFLKFPFAGFVTSKRNLTEISKRKFYLS